MTITAAQHRDLLRLMEHFRAVLNAAAKERPLRQGTVTTDTGTELAWVMHERTTLHQAVNRAREEHGLPPVPLAAVERAESMACGHIDYVKKFALYCAELASPAVQAQIARTAAARETDT